MHAIKNDNQHIFYLEKPLLKDVLGVLIVGYVVVSGWKLSLISHGVLALMVLLSFLRLRRLGMRPIIVLDDKGVEFEGFFMRKKRIAWRVIKEVITGKSPLNRNSVYFITEDRPYVFDQDYLGKDESEKLEELLEERLKEKDIRFNEARPYMKEVSGEANRFLLMYMFIGLTIFTASAVYSVYVGPEVPWWVVFAFEGLSGGLAFGLPVWYVVRKARRKAKLMWWYYIDLSVKEAHRIGAMMVGGICAGTLVFEIFRRYTA